MEQFQKVESHTYLDSHKKLIIQFDPLGKENIVNCGKQIYRQSFERSWVTQRHKPYMTRNPKYTQNQI